MFRNYKIIKIFKRHLKMLYKNFHSDLPKIKKKNKKKIYFLLNKIKIYLKMKQKRIKNNLKKPIMKFLNKI